MLLYVHLYIVYAVYVHVHGNPPISILQVHWQHKIRGCPINATSPFRQVQYRGLNVGFTLQYPGVSIPAEATVVSVKG